MLTENFAPNDIRLSRHCIPSFSPPVHFQHLHNEWRCSISNSTRLLRRTATNKVGQPLIPAPSSDFLANLQNFRSTPISSSIYFKARPRLLPPKTPTQKPATRPNESAERAPPSAPFPFPLTHLTSPPHHKPPTPLPLPTSPSIPPPHKPPSNNYSTSTLSSALKHLHPTTPLPVRSTNCAQDAQISRLEC